MNQIAPVRSAEIVGEVNFPKPEGLIVNMMPFIMGDMKSIPENMKQYIPLIEACQVEDSQLGQIGYLTITETVVEPGVSHRRGGAHVEKHPSTAPYLNGHSGSWGGGGWGRGGVDFNGQREGGLYVASTLDKTTAVWDKDYVVEPGDGGDVEDFRSTFKEPIILRANQLAWMTDGTPHESLPVTVGDFRQFFRLVTKDVDLWFSEHSTPNPLGIQLPERVKVISFNKFDK